MDCIRSERKSIIPRLGRAFIIVWAIGALIALSLGAGLVYAIYHFVAKFW
jgi:hypothetical protein